MGRSLRVAMVIQAYLPRVGGAERQLAALVEPLRQQNVEVHILTRRYPGLAPFERIDHAPVHRLPVPGPKAIAAVTFILAALPLLRRLRPDVIHAHELLSPATTAVAAKRLLGTPIVATAHRGGFLGDVSKLQQRPLGTRRMSLLRQQIDAFVTISREIDAELAQLGVLPDRRVFIANGVDTDRFLPLNPVERQAVRAALDLPDAPVVIYVGRLVPEKRVDHLVAIWPAVHAVYPEACLLVLGVGPEEAALKEAAAGGVRFAGRIDDVTPYLQAADLFVLPSATEGLSVALLEAMATGLAVIATAVGGTPDLIEHGENGWLIAPQSPTALLDAVLCLLADDNQRRQLGCQGRKHVTQHYALPVTARRLRALYDRLVDRQRLAGVEELDD